MRVEGEFFLFNESILFCVEGKTIAEKSFDDVKKTRDFIIIYSSFFMFFKNRKKI